nr:uncharacterized protein LOC111417517 isoform X1 [Onthophagus taurus]
MQFKYFLQVLILILRLIRVNPEFECKPNVVFDKCKSISGSSNPYWNSDKHSPLIFRLQIRKSCVNSVLDIQWSLQNIKTKQFLHQPKLDNKNEIILDKSNLTVLEPYILKAFVKESAYGFYSTSVVVTCWFRLVNRYIRIEKKAPRLSFRSSSNDELKIETNTPESGWVQCSNPNMFVMVSSEKKLEQNFYFGESPIIEQLINKSSRISKRQNLKLPDDSSLTRKLYELKGRQIDLITDLKYNKKYRFLLCKKRISSKCTNVQEITTCPNLALTLNCSSDVGNKTLFENYVDVIGINCTLIGNAITDSIAFGLYSINGGAPNGKGPKDILIGHYTDYKSIYFRLFHKSEHTVVLKPIDSKTHVRFPCKLSRCNSMSSFRVISTITDSLDLSMQAQIALLREAQKGKIPCPLCNSKLSLTDLSFSSMISSGKFNDAVQFALILLKDQEMLVMKDIEANEFQISMLSEFAKITDWTWPRLEQMVGLLPYFDLEDIPKEIAHTKAKALLLKNMMNGLKTLITSEQFHMTPRIDMEEIYFDEFYKQISALFGPDFIKPYSFDEAKVHSPPFHGGKEEDYEDYDENMDDIIIDDFIMITNDGLEALSNLLFARSKTHHYKEEHLVFTESSLTSKIFTEKENIDYIITDINEIFYVELGYPVAMPPTEKEFRFIWSLIDKEAFFWHHESYKCTIQYLMIQFYSGDEEVTKNFNTNPVIEINLPSQSVNVQADGIVVPSHPDDWTDHIINRFMRVYRINVKKYLGYTLGVYIQNITRVERLRVIVDTNGTKPVFEDFANPKTEILIFDKTNSSKFVAFSSNTSTVEFWYIAVLPYKEDIAAKRKLRSLKGEDDDDEEDIENERERIETVGIQYLNSFMMYSCPMFVNGEFKHDICTVLESSTTSRLECECPEVGGPLAPSFFSVSYKIYGIVDISTNLELSVHFIVVIFTLIAIFIYCFLLILWPYRSRPSDLIYFLGDNAKQSRFGYLVRLTTADFKSSGTTAHIGIQLYGSISNSRRHILNHPDPFSRLLQTASVNHFLIATDEALGNIVRLELWSDCSGFRPEWYCESIRVYDVQSYISWHFNVQKRFSVTSGHYSHYFVKPTHPSELTIRTPWLFFNSHHGGNHTWNILDTSHDQYWSYPQRLSIMLTHVLGTFAFALYMIHPPIFEYQDGIGISRFNDVWFIIKTIVIVTIVVAPVNYVLACFLRGSYKSGRFRGRYGYFPTCYSTITHISLFIINTLCLVYCLVYGPFISSVVAHDWILVVVISLLINIFVCENLFLAIHSLIHLSFYSLNAWVPAVGTTYLFREIIFDVENQRRFLYRHLDRSGIRPYILPMYKPLGGDLFVKRKREIKDKSAMKRTYKNIYYVFIMLIFLLVLISFYRDDRAAHFSKHLEDIFVYGTSAPKTPKGIYNVTTHDELYEYLNKTLILAITPKSWYWPYMVADSGLISDINNKYIGNVRIRQQRAMDVRCPQAMVASMFDMDKCISALDNYPILNASYNNALKHNNSMWWFHEEKSSNSYTGSLMIYNGDGYTVDIGKTRSNALYRVRLLFDNKWLDERTKFIIIEFLLYNANTNLFADVKLAWERESKYMYPSQRIITAKLLNLSENWNKLNIIFFLVYIYISFRILIFLIQAILNRYCGIFKSWREVGLLIFCILNICSIVLFIQRNIAINSMLDELKHADRKKFISYSHVVLIHKDLEVILGIMIFIMILMLINFLEIISWTSTVTKTIRKAFPLFLTLCVYITVYMLYYAIVTFMFYGNTLEDYQSFSRCCINFFLMLSRCNKPDAGQTIWEQSASIVIFESFLIVGTFWFIKAQFFMGCAWYLNYCKKEGSAMRNNYTFYDYLRDKFQAFKIKWRLRLYFMNKHQRYQKRRERGGQSDTNYITPAPDCYRYHNAVYLSEWRLKKQEQVTTAYLRNTYVRERNSRPSKIDLEFMRDIAELGIGPKPFRQDLYFEQRLPATDYTTTIVVPDEKIRTMARITEKILHWRGKEDKDVKVELKDLSETSKEEKSKNLKKECFKTIGTMQSRQLQGMLVILEISNDVIDSLAQKLLGTFTYDQECCCDNKN